MRQIFMNQLLGFVLALGLAAPVAAQQFAAPQDDALLTVSGEIAQTNVGETLVLDREMLMALPATTLQTSTIWTDGVHSFTGVALSDLVGLLGVSDGTISATAINDYSVEIPLSDAQPGGPIIAYHLDGQPMSVREKGPLWVIYPYDSDAKYRTEVIYSRSIWQLDRLVIVQ